MTAELLDPRRSVDGALAVPEQGFREALAKRTVRVGRPLPAEGVEAFVQAGATESEAVTMPVLLDARAGFRVGRSVPGGTDLSAEIAQGSAGLHPTTSARFGGLFGEVRLRRSSGGYALWVRGAMTWASPSAGTMDLVFRPPVSMKGEAEGTKTTPGPPRRVSLPSRLKASASSVFIAVMAPMSAPATNARSPAPVMMTARASG